MRTHYCGQVNEQLTGASVAVAGWVHRRRDHGGVIFVDLRDREGLVQIVFHPDQQAIFVTAEKLRHEFVVRVRGTVRPRPTGTVNPSLASGRVEIVAWELELLNRCDPLPFQLDEAVSEEVRLRYRYIDLRREIMNQRLRLRHRITRSMRGYLDAQGFVDVETPMLTKATPEGARDYLVPSRTHAGKFFALPQSPQIFKQLLMIAGFERYYQIVRFFLRADRQPEFTQLDIETSFLTQDQIMQLMEGLVVTLFREVLSLELPQPFPRISYAEAMRRYGSDKPDLRVALELVDVADLVMDCDFKVFSAPAKDAGGRVAALRVPGGGALSRREIDDYAEFVARHGAKGLAYIKVNERARGREGLQSPIIKFLSDAALAGILERTGGADNDLIFFGADSAKVVSDAGRAGAFGRCGWSISRCSSGTRTPSAGPRCITRSPRRRPMIRRRCAATPAAPWRGPTTWCSTVRRSAAGRCVFSGRRCSRWCSACSALGPKRRERNSASCSMRCASVPHRTAALPSVWTGSRC